MQCSVHLPTPFITAHSDALLPEWDCPVASILIVLQRSTCTLCDRTDSTESQKHQLRTTFLQLGSAIAARLHRLGYQADLFDPKSGQPLLSKAGRFHLDDIAVVSACLDYPIVDVRGCAVILHPEWESAVYPSVLLSSAPPELVKLVANSVTWDGGATAKDSVSRSLSEYHHSFMG